jgi:anti-anti-sigma factor
MNTRSPIVEKRGDVTCIRLGPEFESLDETVLDTIRTDLLEKAGNAVPPRVVLDLQHTKFFGSSFIEVLFRIWKRLNSQPNGRFIICGLTPYCREVMTVTHLDKLWPLMDSFDEAVTAAGR